MNEKEKKAIEYYQNKEVSFSVDFDTEKLLRALGITEEDSFENHRIRFKTLLNLIDKLQKENEEKDKIIDLLIKELYTKAHISTRCYLQTSTEECMKYKNCYECLKKHFEKKERRNNGKGN